MSPYAPSRSFHQDDGRDIESRYRVLSTMNPTFSGPNRKDLSNETEKKKKEQSEKACVWADGETESNSEEPRK